MRITSGLLDRMHGKINISFERRSPSTSEQTVKAGMERESITLYLAMQHLRALEIHAEINNILGQSTLGYSTITRYL
jgi:hypothetical protein